MHTVQLHGHVNRTAAILAGHSVYGDVTVDVDVAALTPAQRETLASLPQPSGRNGREGFTLRDDDHLPDLPRLASEDVPAILDFVAARRQAAKERRETATATALAWARGVAPDALSQHLYTDLHYSYLHLVPVPERNEDAYYHADWRAVAADQTVACTIVQARALKEARAEAEKTERLLAWQAEQSLKAAALTARLATLAQITRDHGDPNAIGRLNAGLLAESEQMDIAEDAAFEPLAAYKRYRDSISYRPEGEPVTTCNAQQFAGLQMIQATVRAVHMEAACEIRSDCGRRFVMVTVTFRGLMLSRAYALPVTQA